MGEKIDIIRLKRSDLYSPTYRQLIESLFGKEQAEKRLRYLSWFVVDNPALRNDEKLPIYLCRSDNNYVAQLVVIPVEMILAGKSTRGGWCIDTYIQPNYQRRGIGSKLITAAHEDFPVLITLGQTDLALGMFSKLGWTYNNNRLMYYKSFLRLRSVFKYLSIKTGLIKKGGFRLKTKNISEGSNQVSLESIDTFKEMKISLNRGATEDGKTVAILRYPAFLEWRYIQNPFVKYFIHRVRPFDSCDIYVVWKMVSDNYWRCARIVDVLYGNDVPVVAMKAALNAIRKCAFSYGAEIIECQTSDPLVLNCLPRTFFSTRYPGKRFLYWIRSIRENPFIPIDQWKLYAGDCDVETIDYLD